MANENSKGYPEPLAICRPPSRPSNGSLPQQLEMWARHADRFVRSTIALRKMNPSNRVVSKTLGLLVRGVNVALHDDE